MQRKSSQQLEPIHFHHHRYPDRSNKEHSLHDILIVSMLAMLCGAESLRKLATRNAIRVRPNPDFRPEMTRLIEGLETLFKRKA